MPCWSAGTTAGGITVRRVGNGYYVVDFGADVTGKVILASSARAAPMTGRVAES